jgi:hypothetical protein
MWTRHRGRVRQRIRRPDHLRLYPPSDLRASDLRGDGLSLLQQSPHRRPDHRSVGPRDCSTKRAPNGKLKLMAVEYIVPGEGANPPGVSEAPSVTGWTCTSSSRQLAGISSTPGSGVRVRREYSRTGVRTWSARKGRPPPMAARGGGKRVGPPSAG